jgi:hypothetical protein
VTQLTIRPDLLSPSLAALLNQQQAEGTPVPQSSSPGLSGYMERMFGPYWRLYQENLGQPFARGVRRGIQGYMPPTPALPAVAASAEPFADPSLGDILPSDQPGGEMTDLPFQPSAPLFRGRVERPVRAPRAPQRAPMTAGDAEPPSPLARPDMAAEQPQGETAAELNAAAQDPEGPAPEQQPDFMQSIIKDLATGKVSDEDKWMALAQAGLGMAASRNPFFLGALGEGGLMGLSAFRHAQDRAVQNRIKAAGLQADVNTLDERKRANRAGEGLREREIETTSADRRANLDVAKERLDLEREKFQTGTGSEQAVRLATANYYNALAKAQADGTRGTQTTIQLEDGTIGVLRGDKVVPVTDPDGKPVKGNKLGTGAKSGNTLSILKDMFPDKSPSEIYQMWRGMSADRRRATALNIAQRMSIFPDQVGTLADEIDRDLAAAAGNQTPAAAPAAPSGGGAPNNAAANKVRDDYKAGRITREQAIGKLRELGFE